jgi:hypothetical protein
MLPRERVRRLFYTRDNADFVFTSHTFDIVAQTFMEKARDTHSLQEKMGLLVIFLGNSRMTD